MPLTIRQGVELAKAGTWNTSTGKWTCTRAQIADAVRAGHRFRPPIVKPGHVDSRFDGEPALGRVLNLRASDDGDTLLGDLEIPDWLDEQLHVAYPHRSVEADLGVETADGERYAAVVTGLALLGVTPPAISSLAELQARMAGPGQEPGYVAASAVAASFDPESPAAPEVTAPTDGVSPDGDTTNAIGQVPLAAGLGSNAPSASRIGAHRVDVTPKMRGFLGLDESADEQAVEAALEALKTKAEQPTPTLEAPVVETGTAPAAEQAAVDAAVEQRIAASEARLASKFEQRIAASEAANTLLREELGKATTELANRNQREAEEVRDRILASAVNDGKITPADKGKYEALYAKAPKETVDMLDAIAPNRAFSVQASGYAGGEEGTDEVDKLIASMGWGSES